MKSEILKNFDGQCCSIDDIVRFVECFDESKSRKTIIWNVNDLVKQGKVIRIGRGLYEFKTKPKLQPSMGESAQSVCSLLSENFKYLDVTITDSDVLGQFMNLQPFVTVVVVEIRKSANKAVLSALRNSGVDAYAKRDFSQLEQYISSSQPVVIRPELSANPSLPKASNIRIANIEKILVDLVCDEDIYGQYQGEELYNIYQNATSDYVVNYSQIMKYAAARKKKAEVLEILQNTSEFKKVGHLV